jgi:folate-dependent phosphoribosylglycinamide formyltransferase PurN
MPIPILIITGDQLRHHYFVNRLGERFDVRGVVCEQVYQPTLEGEPEELEDLDRHFSERTVAEERYFAADDALQIEAASLLRIPKGEANSEAVYEWIQRREPEYLILYGSSIIRERLLDAFDQRTINMHLGLSPYYRGSGTNFWPLVNGEPELVGVTIHLATLVVDAGGILKQVRPPIAAEDRNHDIGCKAIIAGTAAMCEAIEAYAAGSLQPQDQQPGGKVFRRGDFDVEAVRQMWRNLDDGMIADYLRQPERAEIYPIVE